ncbi:MAG TPA: hypothetical protein VHM30_02430 [Gemmatimonadaceae bacterium]|nr:hypothetical protein [Gemmatimonadaceae bacterium]
MRTSIALTALAVAALTVSAGASAQATASSAPSRTTASVAAAAWSPKAAGTYDIAVETEHGTETAMLVIAADSAGTLSAKVVEGPQNDEHPLGVAVEGDDLVLKNETHNGTMVITLQRRGASEIAGRWELGPQHGSVTGKLRS